MPRFFTLILISALAAGVVVAQKNLPPPPKQQEPAEEDEALTTSKEYAFNPLQAEKEIKIGRFYLKKGSIKAAAGRFREATKWNPTLAEAWFLLGESEQKLKRGKESREAFAKFIELSPDDKRAAEIKKRLGISGK